MVPSARFSIPTLGFPVPGLKVPPCANVCAFLHLAIRLKSVNQGENAKISNARGSQNCTLFKLMFISFVLINHCKLSTLFPVIT